MRLNEVTIMNNGQKAKLICYRSSKDIDIQFEDGTIVYNKTYGAFKKGSVANPNYYKKNKLNEERVMNNGQVAKIIAYRLYCDLDVMFEDGTIVKSRTYGDFKNGSISNPNYYMHIERLGEKRLMPNGLLATIVQYNNANDIVVELSNGKVINCSYSRFKNNNIGYNYTTRLGEERLMSNGQRAKIVAYRSSRDIDIQFDDKIIVKNVLYCNFVKGFVKKTNN